MAVTINGTTGITSPGLSVDSPTLVVDDANNRVGIGTDNPVSTLHLSNNGAEGLEVYIASESDINVIQHYNRSGSSWVSHRNIALDHRFETYGIEKLRITSSGNVGIGTDNPVALLQVAGTDSVNTNLSIASSTSGDGGVYFYDGSNSGAITYSHSSDNMLFRVGGSEKLRIDSDGRVGIGGNGIGNGLGVFLRRNSPNTTHFYEASDGTKTMITGVDSTIDYVKIGSLSNHRLGLISNNGEKISILPSGNIGIGTTNPVTKLEIAGNTTNVNGYSDGQVQIVGNNPIAFVSQSNLNPALNRWGFQIRATGGDGKFSIYDFNNSRHALLIDANGNIGIGTDNPSAPLEVQRSWTSLSTTNDVAVFARSLGAVSVSVGYDDASTGMYLGTKTNHNLQLRTNNTTQAIITNVGNIGIATTNPSYNLQISKQGSTDWGIGLKRVLSVDNNWVYSTYRSSYTITTSTHPAGWYDIVKFRTWDFNVDVHLSFSGDFTADNITIEAKNAFNAALNNNYSGPYLRVNRTMAHNGNRLQQVRIGYDTSGYFYIQAYLNPSFGAAGAIKIGVVDKASAWSDIVTKAEPLLQSATSVTVVNTVDLSFGGGIGEYYNLSGGWGGFSWGTSNTPRFSILADGRIASNGAFYYSNSGYANLSSTFSIDVPVRDDSGSGQGGCHHVVAAINHYNFSSYGALLDQWVASRGTSTTETYTNQYVTSGQGGSWSVSKPSNTILRVTHTGGSLNAFGLYFVVVQSIV